MGSKRKYGVEVETSYCQCHRELHGKTAFGSKSDPSVDGLEFVSPILYGDQGLEEIDNLLEFAAEKHWEADQYCGCHIHCDLRVEGVEGLIKVAHAYRRLQNLLKQFAAPHRHNHDYSYDLAWSVSDLTQNRQVRNNLSVLDWLCRNGRYNHVNFCAYTRHQTVEIRILEGTVDATTIKNWLKFNTRLIDAIVKMSHEEIETVFNKRLMKDQFAAIVAIIDDAELTDWLAARARSLNHTNLVAE